jgi:hypothetical protein
MRLIQSETVFYDYSDETSKSVKTIVHETSGTHHIRDALLWFRASRLTRVKIEPNNDADLYSFSRQVYGVLGKTGLRDKIFVSTKNGVVILQKFREGVTSGRAQDVQQDCNR